MAVNRYMNEKGWVTEGRVTEKKKGRERRRERERTREERLSPTRSKRVEQVTKGHTEALSYLCSIELPVQHSCRLPGVGEGATLLTISALMRAHGSAQPVSRMPMTRQI